MHGSSNMKRRLRKRCIKLQDREQTTDCEHPQSGLLRSPQPAFCEPFDRRRNPAVGHACNNDQTWPSFASRSIIGCSCRS